MLQIYIFTGTFQPRGEMSSAKSLKAKPFGVSSCTGSLPILMDMLETDLQSKNKHIDAFLNKSPKILMQMKEMVDGTTEFPAAQNGILKLMSLTTDVTTLSSTLIDYIVKDEDLAQQIVEKARLNPKFKQARISSSQLRQSIQRLGYGLVHNEIQDNFAKQYAKVYFQTNNQALKSLIKKSVRLGYIAKELAQMMKLKETNDAFFTGINFYIGELILGLRDERSFAELTKMLEKGVDPKSAELAVLGYDLGELASRKLRSWKLNDRIVDIVHHSRDPQGVRIDNYKFSCLMQFALFVYKSLNDKNSSPQSMWMKAVEYLTMLDAKMSSDDWVEEVRMMYIRVLEAEYRLFNKVK